MNSLLVESSAALLWMESTHTFRARKERRRYFYELSTEHNRAAIGRWPKAGKGAQVGLYFQNK